MNAQEYRLRENDLMIVPPHTVRQPSEAGHGCDLACVAFRPDFL
ncbi:hypothetical protein [Paraflavitalea speifideaquila]|nr:hypothetical protein [Paraflavitalea speifideiaquila]